MIRALSPAKINLILRIIGKRVDGYHEVKTIMQAISLADEIEFEIGATGISIESNEGKLPCDCNNLIYKAAEKFSQKTALPPQWRFRVDKRIPLSSGLGGGSSNAATVLLMLNQFYQFPLSSSQLVEISSGIGSDVPFFLYGGTAFGQGRGEIISELPFPGSISIVLINPGFGVSTAKIYHRLNWVLTSDRMISNIPPVLPAKMQWSVLIQSIKNDLESVVLAEYPEIGEIKQWLLQQGADTAAVSGSGGTVFGIFFSKEDAERTAIKAKQLFPWVEVGYTVDRHSMRK